MRRSKEESLITRKIVLDCALEIFHKKGYNATSLKDICDEAGVTKGALYWHFENKEALFLAMISENIGEFHKITEYYRNKPMKPGEKLMTIYSTLIDKILNSKNVRMALELAISKIEMRDIHLSEEEKRNKKRFMIFTEIIEEGMKSGEFRTEMTALQYNFYINNVIVGLIWGSFEIPEMVNLKEWGHTFLKVTFENVLFVREGDK